MANKLFLPVVHVEGKVYQVDPTYDGDAFEISKNDLHKMNMFKGRLQYQHSLFGLDDKPCYIKSHPNYEGLFVSIEDFKLGVL